MKTYSKQVVIYSDIYEMKINMGKHGKRKCMEYIKEILDWKLTKKNPENGTS